MKKFNTSFRGYEKSEVNAFVSKVADQYESMLNNLKARDSKIEELNEKLKRYQDMESTFNRAIIMAEDTSSQMKRLARNEANSIINDAKSNASRIINNALLKSEKIEQESQTLRRRVNLMKNRLRQALEEELAIIDDIDDMDY